MKRDLVSRSHDCNQWNRVDDRQIALERHSLKPANLTQSFEFGSKDVIWVDLAWEAQEVGLLVVIERDLEMLKRLAVRESADEARLEVEDPEPALHIDMYRRDALESATRDEAEDAWDLAVLVVESLVCRESDVEWLFRKDFGGFFVHLLVDDEDGRCCSNWEGKRRGPVRPVCKTVGQLVGNVGPVERVLVDHIADLAREAEEFGSWSFHELLGSGSFVDI